MSDTHDDFCERIEVDIGVGTQISPCHCDYRRIERENEALRKDAERYRWLRVSKCNPAYPARSAQFGVCMIFGEHLDATIDAAIAAAIKEQTVMQHLSKIVLDSVKKGQP